MNKLKKYDDFVNENVKTKPVLKYLSLDWDNNILDMPTKIHMLHLVDGKWIPEQVSTEKFAIVRNDKDNWKPDPEKAYIEFRDNGPRGNNAFIEDMKYAIENKKFGPAWKKFLHCLINGSIFSLITARGHEPETMKKGVKYIIDTQLSDDDKHEMKSNLIAFQHMFDNTFDILKDYSFEYLVKSYLDKCYFIGVSSDSFNRKHAGDASNPEKAKIHALNDFIEIIKSYGEKTGANVKVGFSDDDPKNINAVEKHFNEIKPLYDDIIKFSVINTNNPEIQGGIKKRI